MKKMSGGKIALIVIAILIIVAVIAAISAYNGLAQARETVSSAESDIQTQLQRRADLIPNLVSTVKTYMAHETEVINAVSEARAKMAAGNTTQEQLEANDELTAAVSRLIAVAESYPDLKSSENFISLQDELAGTENRISAARQTYNEKAAEYNKSIVSFPKNIFAGIFGFDKAEYFKAKAGAEDAPNVSDLFD